MDVTTPTPQTVRNRDDLDTPAVLVDVETLRRNIREMQERADAFGVRLRPHTKTHKCPEIARLQLDAGAAGLTVAKLGEAEVMADFGLEDILIANQIVGAAKLSRLRKLAERVRLAVLVDSTEGVEMLEDVFGAGGALDVLIEVDTGKGRCGLSRLDEIQGLGDRVARTDGLRLRGVETHEGHVVAGAAGPSDIRERAISAGERMVEVAAALREHGHATPEVSVGSTPAAPYTATLDGITEMRPGTYVFNDVNQIAIDQAKLSDCALSVLATVISRPAADRAVLDAGSKALWVERARSGFALDGYEGYGMVRGAAGARIVSLSEEHAVVRLSPEDDFPKIGGRVEVVPNHVCPCVNLHEELYMMEGDTVIDVWPVAARGKVR